MNYIYDGSYRGLVTCFDRIYRAGTAPSDIIAARDRESDLFSFEDAKITTDLSSAARFLSMAAGKLSEESLRDIHSAFFACVKGKDMAIYRYVWYGLEKGAGIADELTDSRVREIDILSQKVSRETHRIKGLLRFRELEDGTYYAAFAPDHDILGFISGYFAKRLTADRWVIHDTARNKAAVYVSGTPPRLLRADQGVFGGEFSEREKFYSGLWKDYFKSTAIRQRLNPKLQASNMPKKYWKYLVEME